MLKQKRDTETLELELSRALIKLLDTYCANTGMSRTVAAEFTFFLAIPTMFGASVLKLAKFGLHFTAAEAVILLTGMVVSFVVSIFVIRFLMGYIRKHDFKVFGWYRIVLGALVLALAAAGIL